MAGKYGIGLDQRGVNEFGSASSQRTLIGGKLMFLSRMLFANHNGKHTGHSWLFGPG